MVCLGSCGNENVSLKTFPKVSYTSTLGTNYIILCWHGYFVTEALKINDYFQLQKRINLIFSLFCFLPRENKIFFLRRTIQHLKLYVLLINIALQYISVQGQSSFAALERAFIKENINQFCVQGFVLMELGRDLILITWCETHHSSLWCFKVQNLWGLQNMEYHRRVCAVG